MVLLRPVPRTPIGVINLIWVGAKDVGRSYVRITPISYAKARSIWHLEQYNSI
jgi:hypothetical protein